MVDGKALSFQQGSALEDYIAASVVIRYKSCQRMSRELLLGLRETVIELKLLLCCCTKTEPTYSSLISASNYKKKLPKQLFRFLAIFGDIFEHFLIFFCRIYLGLARRT